MCPLFISILTSHFLLFAAWIRHRPRRCRFGFVFPSLMRRSLSLSHPPCMSCSYILFINYIVIRFQVKVLELSSPILPHTNISFNFFFKFNGTCKPIDRQPGARPNKWWRNKMLFHSSDWRFPLCLVDSTHRSHFGVYFCFCSLSLLSLFCAPLAAGLLFFGSLIQHLPFDFAENLRVVPNK